jgi:hypothetical protein
MRLSLYRRFCLRSCGVLLATVAGCSTTPASTTSAEHDAGRSITLRWRGPTTNTNGTPIDDLAGYMIEYGPDPSLLIRSIRIPSSTVNTYTMDNLSPGVWYFAVRAFTSAGVQGALSRVVRFTVKTTRRP